ncbi:14102_t:CDS:1, partial [Rhizophagus irregularis]
AISEFTGSVQNPECQNPEWYEIPKYWPTLSIMLPGSGFSGF